MAEQQTQGKLEFWAILELFGHQKIAGHVKEVALGGDAMLRVDVPEIRYTARLGYGPDAKTEERSIPAFTKFYSPKSVFSMTPVSEETARAAMQSFRSEPIQAFELRALPAPAGAADEDDDFDDDERPEEPDF